MSMISYEIYKSLHLLVIFSFVSLSSVLLVEKGSKSVRIGIGVASLLILVSGMGLLARMGVGHGGVFPGWVWGKMGIWLLVSAFVPIAAKRFSEKGKKWTLVGLIIAAFVAATLAINKPF